MAYRRSLCGSEPYTDGSQGYLMIDGYDRGVTVADPRDNDLMVFVVLIGLLRAELR